MRPPQALRKYCASPMLLGCFVQASCRRSSSCSSRGGGTQGGLHSVQSGASLERSMARSWPSPSGAASQHLLHKDSRDDWMLCASASSVAVHTALRRCCWAAVSRPPAAGVTVAARERGGPQGGLHSMQSSASLEASTGGPIEEKSLLTLRVLVACSAAQVKARVPLTQVRSLFCSS